MDIANFIDYGLAAFAVAGILYVVNLFLNSKKNDKDIKQVIDNNTSAINNLNNTIQIMLTRQEQKIDELLERARKA